MASDNSVLIARSAVANACRNGSKEEIAEARALLAQAKADRLRRDADDLEAGIRKKELLITGQAQPLQDRPTREDHQALETRQVEDCQRFIREHGHPYRWENSDRDAWDDLLRSHTDLHVALGCSRNDVCRASRNTSSVKAKA